MFENLKISQVQDLIWLYNVLTKDSNLSNKQRLFALESAFLLLDKPEFNVEDLPEKIIIVIPIKEQKINLIKFLRHTNLDLGLKEAKELVESFGDNDYEIICDFYFYAELIKCILDYYILTYREIWQFVSKSSEE